jgi:hypothetical protein
MFESLKLSLDSFSGASPFDVEDLVVDLIY